MPDKKESYAAARVKFEAKRFFNPASKRFWVAAFSPVALMGAQPYFENYTVESYTADVTRPADTAAQGVSDRLNGLQNIDRRHKELARQEHMARFDGGTPSYDLKTDARIASYTDWLETRKTMVHLLTDPGVNEPLFQYAMAVMDFDNTMPEIFGTANVSQMQPYALNECRIKFNDTTVRVDERAEDIARCMTLDETPETSEVVLGGILGLFSSLLLSQIMLLGGIAGRVARSKKPDPKDYKPKSKGN